MIATFHKYIFSAFSFIKDSYSRNLLVLWASWSLTR